MASHDPRCPWKNLPPQTYDDGSPAECGLCDLIARVRAEERAAHQKGKRKPPIIGALRGAT